MPNVVNRLVVQELTHEFKDAEGMVVVSWGALNAVENETLRAQPRAEIPQVGGVRASRRLGERRAREEPIHRVGRVHVYRFSPARTTPAHAPIPRHRPRRRDCRGGLRR